MFAAKGSNKISNIYKSTISIASQKQTWILAGSSSIQQLPVSLFSRDLITR